MIPATCIRLEATNGHSDFAAMRHEAVATAKRLTLAVTFNTGANNILILPGDTCYADCPKCKVHISEPHWEAA